MKAKFETFKTDMFTLHESIYKNAASFASRIGPENLISFTQGIVGRKNTVVVWFWDKKAESAKERLKSFKQKNSID